jgi:DNA-binding CsgD family transcriptional regulator
MATNDRAVPGYSDAAVDGDLEAASAFDTRRWLRDTGALLALPALWIDREPGEIAAGLLRVLSGMLALDGAFARFDDPAGGAPVDEWHPVGAEPPAWLRMPDDADDARGSGAAHPGIASVSLALPWATGRVTVYARRDGFPTAVERHLLRFAVSQAAIAIHTARRVAAERAAREEAERMMLRRNGLVGVRATAGARPAHPPPLTRREGEVLGLLAEGLSNKEIAGAMWLSDRTVERHITSVYRKIGVARRSEATAFALRHGVV